MNRDADEVPNHATKERTRPIPSQLDGASLVNKKLIYDIKNTDLLWKTAGKSEQASCTLGGEGLGYLACYGASHVTYVVA